MKRPCLIKRLEKMLLLALLLSVFGGDALCQTRYWSSSRGIAGKKIGQAPSETTSRSKAPSSSTVASSPKPAENAQARASLRNDWDAIEEEQTKADVEIPSEGVTVELYIDNQTYSELKLISAETGVPMNQLLYKYLRIGHKSYKQHLRW